MIRSVQQKKGGRGEKGSDVDHSERPASMAKLLMMKILKKWKKCLGHTESVGDTREHSKYGDIGSSAHTKIVVDQSTNQSINANNGQL